MCVLLVVLSASASAQDGLPLFHKMQEALGGAAKISAIRDFEQEVRAESYDGNSGRSLGEVRKRTRWLRPNILRVDQLGPGSTYVLYFDGNSGWEILPGTKEVVALAGGELQFSQKYVRDFVLTTWLADRDPLYRITSPAPQVLRISDGDVSHQLDITVDSGTGLPTKIASISLSNPANPISSESVNAEWETVGGVRFVRHWSVWRGGVRVAEATVEKTRLNSGLKAADFSAKPGDFRPVLSN
jgi:hypothetical protein